MLALPRPWNRHWAHQRGRSPSLSRLRRYSVSASDRNACSSNASGLLQHKQEIDAATEALSLLEWPVLCHQIAGYCSTPTGISASKSGILPIGKSVKESQELQAQTSDALKMVPVLDFSGARDVEKFVEKSCSGQVCNIRELCLVRDTLRCGARLHEQLLQGRELENSGKEFLEVEESSREFSEVKESSREFLEVKNSSSQILEVKNSNEDLFLSPLQMIMKDVELCRELEFYIGSCLDPQLETVLDGASRKLAEVRKHRKQNMESLESLLKETGRKLVAAGAADTVVVTSRRARLCVAVRSSYKSLLSGGVVLDTSNSGATLFMEPQPALELNNLEMQLAEAERAEELDVLRQLTKAVADAAPAISSLSKAITLLDFACARAKHAKWLGAVRPAFGSEVNVQGIRHPLLLASAISGNLKLPVPVDIRVKQAKVVIISGPNTGGKTVALKTLGIAAVMAKAGLFLPAVGEPELPWFDHVFADVGDSQSLVENLSTFSGHIRRISRIICNSGPESLVLIDEIGGGTDPTEGSALATALLKYFARTVRLTFVTTHSASLKTLQEHDLSFENASVEFDLKTLRPTYRILWGVAGQSNALKIAESLEFDSRILDRAQYWLTKLTPAGREARQSDLMVQLMKQSEQEQNHATIAASCLADVKMLHDELNAEAAGLEKRKAALKQQQVAATNREIAEARKQIEALISRFEAEPDVGSRLRAAQYAISAVVKQHDVPLNDGDSGQPLPEVGEKVLIRRLGKKAATVLKGVDETGHVTVQLGTLKMRVKADELMPTAKTATAIQKRPVLYEEPEVQAEDVKFSAAVQTSRNTVDLRGLTVEDALQVLQKEIARREQGSVIFIVHGIGTGALKKAVVALLERHPRVVKFEDESFENGGCTVAYIA